MPLILNSSYQYTGFWKNKHLQTLIPYKLRHVNLKYTRERIHTPDNDFLDLDWSIVNSDKVCLLLHGLEGSSESTYMKGITIALNKRKMDVVAMNYRGCSGVVNNLPSAYHSGKTEDIDLVIQHIASKQSYKEITLIGVSIGGNLTLKYLGEKGNTLSPFIKKAAVLCCPIDLASTSTYLSRFQNKIYLNNFIKSFKEKLKEKQKRYPHKIDLEKLNAIKTFWDLDNYYTAPLHGFGDAKNYYKQVSAINYLDGVSIPTLMVTAKNDPFLPKENYPIEIAKNHKHLFLEITKHGGHIGYLTPGKKEYWYETRLGDFVNT